jgi:hypothetical protein
MDVHLSEDGKRMASAGYDNRVVVWERTAFRADGDAEEEVWIKMGELTFAEAIHAVRMDDEWLCVAAGASIHALHVGSDRAHHGA